MIGTTEREHDLAEQLRQVRLLIAAERRAINHLLDQTELTDQYRNGVFIGLASIERIEERIKD